MSAASASCGEDELVNRVREDDSARKQRDAAASTLPDTPAPTSSPRRSPSVQHTIEDEAQTQTSLSDLRNEPNDVSVPWGSAAGCRPCTPSSARTTSHASGVDALPSAPTTQRECDPCEADATDNDHLASSGGAPVTRRLMLRIQREQHRQRLRLRRSMHPAVRVLRTTPALRPRRRPPTSSRGSASSSWVCSTVSSIASVTEPDAVVGVTSVSENAPATPPVAELVPTTPCEPTCEAEHDPVVTPLRLQCGSSAAAPVPRSRGTAPATAGGRTGRRGNVFERLSSAVTTRTTTTTTRVTDAVAATARRERRPKPLLDRVRAVTLSRRQDTSPTTDPVVPAAPAAELTTSAAPQSGTAEGGSRVGRRLRTVLQPSSVTGEQAVLSLLEVAHYHGGTALTGRPQAPRLLPDLAVPADARRVVTIVFDLDETLCNNRCLTPALLRPGAIALLRHLRTLYPSPRYKQPPQRRPGTRLYDQSLPGKVLSPPVYAPRRTSASGAAGLLLELVLWTASVETVARRVVRRLDPEETVFDYAIYRDARWYSEGGYTKNLRHLGRAMERVVIVENAPGSVMLNPRHAILVHDFVRNRADRQLYVVRAVLTDWLHHVADTLGDAATPTASHVTRDDGGESVTPQPCLGSERDAHVESGAAPHSQDGAEDGKARETRAPENAVTTSEATPADLFLAHHPYMVAETNYIRLAAVREAMQRFIASCSDGTAVESTRPSLSRLSTTARDDVLSQLPGYKTLPTHPDVPPPPANVQMLFRRTRRGEAGAQSTSPSSEDESAGADNPSSAAATHTPAPAANHKPAPANHQEPSSLASTRLTRKPARAGTRTSCILPKWPREAAKLQMKH